MRNKMMEEIQLLPPLVLSQQLRMRGHRGATSETQQD